MEPDLRWERFLTAVRLLAERLGVRRVIGLGAIPMAVPHTRPITLTAHANDKELIAEHQPWVGEVQVPGSVSNLLEFRMSQHGYEVVGFTVHVPHYLAQTDYPAAAEVLLAEVAKSGVAADPAGGTGRGGRRNAGEDQRAGRGQHRSGSGGDRAGAPVRRLRRRPGEPVAAGPR